MTQAVGRPPRRAGFTLFEILLVVAIIALAAGLVVPKLWEVAGVELKSAARRLAGAARYAADQAAVRKAPHRIVFDFAGRAYRVEYLDGEEWRPDPATLGRVVRLPGQVRLAAVETRARGRATEGLAAIEFYPKGYAERALVQLALGEEAAYTVEIRPFDPRPRVHAGLVDMRDADARAFVAGSR